VKPNIFAGDPRLPIRRGPVRFAVGPPDGLTSNSWRFWTTRAGDAYVACRDNMKEVKVSLHASGHWRVGITEEALAKNPGLVAPGANRAWDVWEAPSESVPNTVLAFRMNFAPSELVIRPEQRIEKLWRGTVYLEPAPLDSGQLTAVTLFVTRGDHELKSDPGPSCRFACLELGDGRWAQLVAYLDSLGNVPEALDKLRQQARVGAERKGINVPDAGYIYAFGSNPDGSRALIMGRAWVPELERS
jgi:hypothetical protein